MVKKTGFPLAVEPSVAFLSQLAWMEVEEVPVPAGVAVDDEDADIVLLGGDSARC